MKPAAISTIRVFRAARCPTGTLILPRRTYASSTTPDIYDVVCVGGGPAGLSLLAGLRATRATSHLKVALIESQDLNKNVFQQDSHEHYSNRCSSLTPASVAYFKKIGAWQHINTARVQPYQGMQVWDGISDARLSFDWASPSSILVLSTLRSAIPQSPSPRSQSPPSQPGSQTIAYMIENSNIATALRTHLSTLGGLTTFSPSRVESISLGSETPEVDLSSWPLVTLSTGETLAARLLIGADGANSPVRSFAGIESRGWDYDQHGLVATLRLAPSPSPLQINVAYQRFLPSGPIALLPLPGNLASLVWSTTPARAALLKSLSPEAFVALVNAAFRLSYTDITYLHSITSGHEDEIQWRARHTPLSSNALPARVESVQDGTRASFPLRMRHADTYTGSRVALIGDAAHTIHPLAGQGLNLGQADVSALLSTITEAVESGSDIGSTISLEGYNTARYASNNAVMGVCDKLQKLFGTENAAVVGARSLGFWGLDKLGPVKGLIMRAAAGGS